MSATDRRTVLRFAGAAVLLPALSAAPLGAKAQTVRFAPPAEPMLYTRRLERQLPGGAAFTVSRSFEVRFLRNGEGYRVEGRQVDVEVEAPEVLAAFARIEREREELRTFVNALHQSAGRLVTELPRDLFAPAETPRSHRREVALPGGDSGEVTVTFSAVRDPATGLMRRALREVVTRLDGERRTTLESWQLTPLS